MLITLAHASPPRFYLPFEDVHPPVVPSHFDSAIDGHRAELSASGISVSTSAPALSGDPGSCTYLVMDEAQNGRVKIPYKANMNADSFTVSFWLRLRPSSGWGMPYQSFFLETHNDFRGHGTFLSNTGSLYFMTGHTPGVGDGRDHLVAANAVSLNQFHHVALTYSRTSVASAEMVMGTKTIYINGVSVATKVNAPYRPMTRATHLSGVKDFLLGDQSFTQSPRYTSNLDLDELRVYDYAQTAAQVLQDYQASHPCPEKPPVLNLPFEDVFAGESASGFSSTFGGHSATPNSSGVTVADVSPARAGRPGSCEYLSFDSAQRGSIEIPYSDDFNRDSFTVSFWLRLGSNSQVWRSLYNSASGGGTDYRGHAIFLLSTNKLYYATARRATDPQQVWDYLTFDISGANQFQHITVTFKKTSSLSPETLFGTKKLYINGALVATKNNAEYRPQTQASTKMPFSLGNRHLNHAVYPTNGDFDELKIYDYAQTAAQVQSNYNATHACRSKPPRIHLPFESAPAGSLPSSFASTVNGHMASVSSNGMEIKDTQTALVGDPGSCEYMSVEKNQGGGISIPHHDDFHRDNFSVSFWLKQQPVSSINHLYNASGNGGYGHDAFVLSSGNVWFATAGVGAGDGLIGGPINFNQWYFLTFTYERTGTHANGTASGTKRIYINGALSAVKHNAEYRSMLSAPTKAVVTVGARFFNSSQDANTADYDEFRIYDYTQSAAEVQADYQKRHVCPVWPTGPDHLKVTHDGSGVFYCPENFNITARKNDTSLVTSYTETIQLSTNNNLGVWQKSPTNSLGTLTPSGLNDGRASYTFVPADNGEIDLRLVMPHGAGATQVNITDGTVSDDNTHGDLNLASLGFEVDKVPGAGFGIVKAGENQTIELRAYNSNSVLNSCALATNYAGPKNIQMRMDALNPASFQVPATVTPSGGGSVNLPTAGSGYANVPLPFNNGIAQLTLNYPDVGKLRLRARDAVNTAMQGASIEFVSRPYRMQLTVTNPDDPNTGDTVFAEAGEPFTVRFQAYAKGDVPTRNFGRETPAVQMGTFPIHAWPSGGSLGTLSGTYQVDNGALLSTDASYSEAGRLNLWAHMVWNGTNNNYLGVPVDYYSDVVSRSYASNIGRFIPDKFEYSQVGTGQWSGGCNGYSYLGQTLTFSGSPKMKVTAVNRQGVKTTNYRFGVSASSMSYVVSYSGFDTQTDNREGNPLRVDLAVAQSFIQSTDSSVGGEMLLTPRASIRYRLEGQGKQDIAPFTPNVPILLNSFSDSDGVALSVDPSNPHQILPTALPARRGRVALASGHASANEQKSFDATVEYFNGTQFVVANTDNCSSISQLLAVDVDANDNYQFLSGTPNWRDGITPSAQTARSYVLADNGVLNYQLPALSDGNASGSVEVIADVAHHLRYAWQSNGLISLPSSVIVYGDFAGQEDLNDGNIVMIQELF